MKLTGRAGDVVLWNGALYHAAMRNTDTQARRLLLYNFVPGGARVRPLSGDSDGALRGNLATTRWSRIRAEHVWRAQVQWSAGTHASRPAGIRVGKTEAELGPWLQGVRRRASQPATRAPCVVRSG